MVPPNTGIVHQVNLERLARVVFERDGVAYPDTLVGTDSHTTMINGLGVLGWGVGGIEAEAAMLGQPVSMLIPRVVGFKLVGQLPAGATATDLVLTVTEQLRKHGVVGSFVEFFGPGVTNVPLADRATIGNMSPEYGSTCAIFPIDDETLAYMKLTGRPEQLIALTEAYAKEQGMWHDPSATPRFTTTLELDLATVVPSLAGPKRPQDRVPLTDAKAMFRLALRDYASSGNGHGKVTDGGIDEASRESFPASDPAQPVREQAERPADQGQRRRGRRPAVEPGPDHAVQRQPGRARPRRGRDRGDHVVHQHLEPLRDGRRRPAGQGRGREGPDHQALGQDHAGARLQGRHRLLREGRAQPLPRQARLQHRRLRLHDLHRQLRPAPDRGVRRGQRGRPRGRQRAVRQPQLRGPHQPRHQDELPRVAAAGRRLRPGRLDGHGHHHRAARASARTAPVYLKDIWPTPADVARVVGEAITEKMYADSYVDVFAGDDRWRAIEVPAG